MSKISCVFIIIVFTTVSLMGQVMPAELKELKEQLREDQSDEKRVDLLNEISYNSYRYNEDSTKVYAEKAIELSEEIGYQFGLATAYKNISTALAGEEGNFESVFEYLNKAKKIAREINDKRLEVICNNNTALLYFKDRNFESALTYLTEGRVQADIYLEDNERIKIFLSGNLGQCYNYLKDYKKASLYLSQTLKQANLYGQEDLKSIFLPDFIFSQYMIGEIKNPHERYEEVMALQRKRNDVKSEILSLTYKTQIFFGNEQYDEAIKVATDAYKLSDGNTYYYKAEVGILLAKSYFEKKNFINAEKYSREIYELLNKGLLNGHLLEAIEILYLIEEGRGNYVEVNKLKSEHINLSEKLINTSKARIIKDLEYRYEEQLQERKIQRLNNQRLRQSYLIWFLSILSIILLAFSFWINRLFQQKKKVAMELMDKNVELKLIDSKLNEKNIELQETLNSNVQLENFAYIASHDLKQPLRTVLSFAEMLELTKSDSLDTEARRYIDFIKNAAKRLDKLINDLLSYSIIGTSGEKELINTNELVSDVIKSLEKQMQEKNAKFSVGNLSTIYGYKSELISLFQNLISNAIKYSKKGRLPKIEIDCEDKSNELIFKIKDNGKGFKLEYTDRIFRIFQRLENSMETEGTGIGLARCKKIVELHNGKIWVESVLEEGSVFYFSIKKEIGF